MSETKRQPALKSILGGRAAEEVRAQEKQRGFFGFLTWPFVLAQFLAAEHLINGSLRSATADGERARPAGTVGDSNSEGVFDAALAETQRRLGADQEYQVDRLSARASTLDQLSRPSGDENPSVDDPGPNQSEGNGGGGKGAAGSDLGSSEDVGQFPGEDTEPGVDVLDSVAPVVAAASAVTGEDARQDQALPHTEAVDTVAGGPTETVVGTTTGTVTELTGDVLDGDVLDSVAPVVAAASATDAASVVVDDIESVASEGDAVMASSDMIAFDNDASASVSESYSDYAVAMKTSSEDEGSSGYDVHGNTSEERTVTADDASQDQALPHTESANTVHTLPTTTVADTTKDLGSHTHDVLL